MILARLLSATPQTDGEHWDLAFRWHWDQWYTDVYSQNPSPYQRNPQSSNPPRLPYPWRPDLFIWGASDALFPQLDGFGLKIDTTQSPPLLDIFGQTPVNALPSGFAPQHPVNVTGLTTGGTIPSGGYVIGIGAGSGPVSAPLIIATMPPGTTTGSFVIPNIIWQAAASNLTVWAGVDSMHMHSILPTGQWSGSVNDTYGNPTTFTISDVSGDGYGLPDVVFNSFLFQAFDIEHGGVWGSNAATVGTSGGVATATNPAWAWTTNQWAGYTLSSYEFGPNIYSGGSGPLNFTVASNTATTLTFASLHGPAAGVAIVMRAKSGSITSNTIGDANFVNALGPSGLNVNQDAGNQIRVIAGTGANQPLMTIVSNTATVFTIAGPWAVTPDATSVWIVQNPTARYSVPSGTVINNGTGTTPVVGAIPLLNFAYGSLLIEAITVDVNGNWSVERYAPIREVWIPPSGIALGGVGVTVDGAGSVPATGSLGFFQAPYGGTITGWTILAKQSGSAQITVKKAAYSALPTTVSIDASAPPVITGAQFATSTSLLGWTTAVTAGDVFEFNLDSITTITRFTLIVQITKQ